jgi:SAM-dependent methyltransferase
MSTSQLESELRALVLRGLETPYSSFSSTDESETGNRYQAVGLGALTTRGLREDRARFLDALDLTGKKVLDLGSNLGELSRAARARGAALVDGWEIDPYFNEIGDLVNALTKTTGVSFYERDMSDPDAYDEQYDVVFAFSAFRFIAGCVARIAAITSLLVCETHELLGNLDTRYLQPIAEHFPSYRVLGESDVERLRSGGARAVILFARDEEALLGALAPELRRGGAAAGVLAAGTRAKRIRGEIERLELREGRLRVEGWCTTAEATPDTIELSTAAPGLDGTPRGTLAVAVPSPRAGLAPSGTGARAAGFSFDCEAPLAPAEQVRFDVTAFAGPATLGSLSGYCRASLPDDPGARLALTAAHELLEPVARYRALETFRRVMLSGAEAGVIEPFLGDLLPAAELAERDVDLVVAHPALFDDGAPAEQATSLDELHRVVAPGGYLTLGVMGDKSKTATIAGLAERFDVLTYVANGVAGLYDLAVLRRP